MRLAIAEFTNHAGDWYQHLKSERRRKEEDPIETWEELKEAMRKRYVPKHYERNLKTKLQGWQRTGRILSRDGNYDEKRKC